MKEMKMVKIVAEDWRLDAVNMEIEKATALMPACCIVVGMLLDEGKRRVVICQEYFRSEDTVRSMVVIPTACILSMVELKMSNFENATYPIKVDDNIKILTVEEIEAVRIKNSKWENQTIEEQSREILTYIGQDPKQRLIPAAEIDILKEVLIELKAMPGNQGTIHTLRNICMVILQFMELDPKQTLIPPGRVQLMRRTIETIVKNIKVKKHEDNR